MTSQKRSSFPNVLDNYVPDSESQTSPRRTAQEKQDNAKRATTSAAATKPSNSSSSSSKREKSHDASSHQKRRNTSVSKKGHDDVGDDDEDDDDDGGGGGGTATKDHHQHQRRESSTRRKSVAKPEQPGGRAATNPRQASVKGERASGGDLAAGDGEQVTGKQRSKKKKLSGAQQEKFERTFESWQQIKEEVREEELERLNNKINLQKELIRAQDTLAEERRQHDHTDRLKKREAERTARNSQTDERRQICRESLDEDRSKLALRRARRGKKQDATAVNASTPRSHVSMEAAPTRPHRQTTEVSQHSSLDSGPLQHPNGPDDDLVDPHDVIDDIIREEEEYDDDEVNDEDVENALPWHHQQLYDLYGRRQADYFLHPKIETIKKRDVKPLNPNMRRVGGHSGAGALWTNLRNDSRMKILQEDSKLISPELKGAYSAFSRELLQKRRRRPVKRNFYSSEDVPEIDRLLDQSRLHEAHDYRHKVELMLRSSHINEERTAILAFNNPLPDLNNAQGEESISRYLPSWAPDNWEQESEMSYRKWLETVAVGPHGDPSSTHGNPGSPLPDSPASPHAHQWQLVPIGVSDSPGSDGTPRKTKANDGKLTFLTEQAATVPGQFSRRRKDLLAQRRVPEAHQGAQSAPPSGSRSDDTQHTSLQHQHQSDDSARRRSSSVQLPHWAPLSMSALVEYSKHRGTIGEGPFSAGKTSTWMVQGAAA